MIVASNNVSLTVHGTNAFDHAVDDAVGGPLRGATIETVQVNSGLMCNLACRHCHVESSPKKQEQADWPTLCDVLDAFDRAGAKTIDITGGAPEMNPHFRRFIREARRRGAEVMVRTNLTIMLEDGYEGFPEFYRDQGVHLVASLPCYMEENVKRQRGLHVFHESIEVIQQLNAVGYGRRDDLPLDLVYNPIGPSLPPPEKKLEADYRRVLKEQFDIDFTTLIAITNLPIGRFQHDLDRDGRGEAYRQLLRESFNPATVDGLMCRHQLHVAYDGTMYDCDFNYAIDLAAQPDGRAQRPHVRDFDPETWRNRRIMTGEHCFGCTAGCGSSCGGTLTQDA